METENRCTQHAAVNADDCDVCYGVIEGASEEREHIVKIVREMQANFDHREWGREHDILGSVIAAIRADADAR